MDDKTKNILSAVSPLYAATQGKGVGLVGLIGNERNRRKNKKDPKQEMIDEITKGTSNSNTVMAAKSGGRIKRPIDGVAMKGKTRAKRGR